MRLSRLLSILALVALLFAPAGMLGSHAAMAMPAAATMDHCAGEQAPADDEERAMASCAAACAAMPAADLLTNSAALLRTPSHLRGPAPFIDGTKPEATTPPPRVS